MINRLESDPAAVRARVLTDLRVGGVTVGRIHICGMTAKSNQVSS